MKPLNKVKIKWSTKFAYAIGLLTTDGSLSIDRRHINFTSKDHVLVKTFKDCLGINNSIGVKARGGEREKKYFQIQFGDVIFYKFLLALGLTPRKSKNIRQLIIPRKYLFDFLRGHLDGDGSFYSYWDPRWRSSYMFYLVFVSASRQHLFWIQNRLKRVLAIKGHITHSRRSSVHQLKYAKKESLKLLKKIYYSKQVVCLERKRLKIRRALAIIGEGI